MYTINFFTLKTLIDNAKYIEELEDYELKLSTLDDVKSFLSSDFYENVYENLLEFTDGIVITDNRNDSIIYKERFNTDTLFDMHTDEEGNIIYNAIGAIEGDCCNYVMIDYLTDKLRINYTKKQ